MGTGAASVLGPWALDVTQTTMVRSMVSIAAAVSDRPITSVIALVELMLIVWIIRMLFTGRLITGREADERDKRYDAKVAECTQLRETVAGFTGALETSNAMIRAIMVKVDEEERAAARPPTRRRARETAGGQGDT